MPHSSVSSEDRAFRRLKQRRIDLAARKAARCPIDSSHPQLVLEVSAKLAIRAAIIVIGIAVLGYTLFRAASSVLLSRLSMNSGAPFIKVRAASTETRAKGA